MKNATESDTIKKKMARHPLHEDGTTWMRHRSPDVAEVHFSTRRPKRECVPAPSWTGTVAEVIAACVTQVSGILDVGLADLVAGEMLEAHTVTRSN
jgi:hypothetical protein